jgi:signal transduction histidine kinase
MQASDTRDEHTGGSGSTWSVLTEPSSSERPAGRRGRGAHPLSPVAPPSQRGLLVGLAVAAVLAVAVVLGASIVVARQLAEAQAVAEAARTAELLGDVVVEPAITDALLDGDEDARSALDELVQSRVIGDSVVRVKLWDPSGTILYSDEARLIGERFALDEEELEAFGSSGVDAEVSNLDAPENRFETGGGDLLEAYHAVRTPSGRSVLFEAYFRYDEVLVRSRDLGLALSVLAAASILTLLLLLAPIGHRMFTALRDARLQRERLLQHAIDASSDERRRIAARLHDGAIQDLTASALVLGGAASRARAVGDVGAAAELDAAARSVRGSISGLRSLLVDVYPPSLGAGGIGGALDDLATVVRGRGVDVALDLHDAPPLDGDEARLVFRLVRECLANAVRHARAHRVVVSITRGDDPSMRARIDVSDDGRGFDVTALERPAEGHIGIPLLTEAAASAGARLAVRSRAGTGTTWVLELPSRDDPRPSGPGAAPGADR